MKAIVMNQTGSPDVLVWSDVPDPQPAPDQVVVRLGAASVNHVDIWVRTGAAAYPVDLPHVPGADGAGTVESIGAEVEGVSAGDRVVILPGLSCGKCGYCRRGQDNQCDRFEILGTRRYGTYAEKVAVPDSNVIPLPDSVDFSVAAALPVAYLTAWHMLVSRAQLRAQETLLVTGIGSGVAVAGLQIARRLGARVLATTTDPAKVEKARALGADDVLLAAEGVDIAGWVKDRTGGRGADVALDHVGPATFPAALASLAKYGRLTTCGTTSGGPMPLELRTIFGRSISVFGARLGTKKDFQNLCSELFSGAITPVIDSTFPMNQAAQAHARMESRAHCGKIVLTC